MIVKHPSPFNLPAEPCPGCRHCICCQGLVGNAPGDVCNGCLDQCAVLDITPAQLRSWPAHRIENRALARGAMLRRTAYAESEVFQAEFNLDEPANVVETATRTDLVQAKG